MDDVPESKPDFPKSIHDNGMLHLVLHYLAMKLIKEMEIEEETKFNQRQREMIEDKITGFYDEILSHPALQDSRVVFHPKVPHYKTILPYSEKEKRTSSSGRLTEICESLSEWKQLGSGKNLNHRTVLLHRDQSFYVTSCVHQGAECSTIADGITSECRSRTSWASAYLDGGDNNYFWSYIAIHTCCSCAARQSRNRG
ncbi:uncharacterized protein LOC117291352 [Asterias rubens]|uniref:uncharacterized protein LOC117291352 n=1 Tax=Asterias rubens TaxID=7604 RepID=UPI00145585DA|nr:uncharacterized protein LOC117291352 [Asterias rubens]